MSEETTLNKIILNKNLTGEARAYLKHYLCNAPQWLLESMKIVDKDKGSVFIKENQAVDVIYILIDGIVRALDYRFFGIEYDYMWFYAVKAFGAMEILLNMERYKTTLMTVTSSTFIVIPKSKFEKWMINDINALRMETKSMGNYLLEQARKERLFLFLHGADRITYLFTQMYEQNDTKERLVLNITRKELSERSGLSIKTINRSIHEMEEKGYIHRSGHKIIILKSQYTIMKEYLEPILDQT